MYYDSINAEHKMQRGIFGTFDYVYWSNGGEKKVAGLFEKYGEEYDTEDEITVVSNTKTKQLSFAKNGKDQGIAYDKNVYTVTESMKLELASVYAFPDPVFPSKRLKSENLIHSATKFEQHICKRE